MSPLTIQVDIKNCSGLNNGPQHVHFTEEVLLLSAITVGRASLKHVLANGIFSQFEVKIKIYKIISYLQKDKAGNLYYTDAFESLDPSEKCGVSYFMGLVFTKLLANRFYNIRYLLHYDIYKKYLVPQSVRTNAMKPDLLGLSGKGMWNVFESKGREKNHHQQQLIRQSSKQMQYHMLTVTKQLIILHLLFMQIVKIDSKQFGMTHNLMVIE